VLSRASQTRCGEKHCQQLGKDVVCLGSAVVELPLTPTKDSQMEF